jgi:predicted nuclease of predicted toxin-antitoxin system
MRFLVDAQLPPALARWLSDRGHDAQHVCDIELDAASDHVVWSHAERHAAVLITKDEDFAAMALRAHRGPAIVWLRLGNTTRSEILAVFEDMLPRITALLERGERIVEIR